MKIVPANPLDAALQRLRARSERMQRLVDLRAPSVILAQEAWMNNLGMKCEGCDFELEFDASRFTAYEGPDSLGRFHFSIEWWVPGGGPCSRVEHSSTGRHRGQHFRAEPWQYIDSVTDRGERAVFVDAREVKGGPWPPSRPAHGQVLQERNR